MFDAANLKLLQENDAYQRSASEVLEYWDKYEGQLSAVSEYFAPVPISLNLEKKMVWISECSRVCFRGCPETNFARSRIMHHGVGYGDHVTLDNGNTITFYVNWDDGPGGGNAYSVEYSYGQIVNLATRRGGGAAKVTRFAKPRWLSVCAVTRRRRAVIADRPTPMSTILKAEVGES